jgi:hypothetical protein
MIKKLVAAAGFVLMTTSVQAITFHPISSISSSTIDFFPINNLIQGPGVGFDASAPHDKISGGPVGDWVTDAPGGFPADYIAVVGMPVLTIDLGQDRLLSEISVWGYQSSNANGVSEFSLRFATDAEGIGGFGTSIGFNPTYFPTNNDILRQSFAFGPDVSTRYVEFTAVDNFFIAPGDGSGGETPGGDRVGLGEIAFAIAATSVPEPTTLLLLGLGLAGLGVARRRNLSASRTP